MPCAIEKKYQKCPNNGQQASERLGNCAHFDRSPGAGSRFLALQLRGFTDILLQPLLFDL